MNRHDLFKSLRAPLAPKSYRTTERRPKTRHPKRTITQQQEPHTVSEPNAFKVFSSILRDLRALNALDRGRVMDAIEAELNYKPGSMMALAEQATRAIEMQPADTEVASRAPHVDPRMDELIGVSEAARIAGVSSVALYSAIARGAVKADKSTGGVKITRSAAMAYKAHARPRKSRRKARAT